jgi:hypothetical protein
MNSFKKCLDIATLNGCSGQERMIYGKLSYGHKLRVSARNNYTSCLSFGPSPALHPPAHIPICAGECALVTNQNPAPYCAIIYCRDPEVADYFRLKLDSSTSNWLGKLLKSLFLKVENPHLVVPQTQFKTFE